MSAIPRTRHEAGTEWGELGHAGGESAALARLWRGCMLARCFIAAVLVSLQALSYGLTRGMSMASLLLALGYLAATALTLGFSRFKSPIRSLGGIWLLTIGVDLSFIALLQTQQAGHPSYMPLFALPVLMAAVLGTRPVGWGTASAIAVLLWVDASWQGILFQGELTARLVQAGATSSGLFLVALLAHELAMRLAREEIAAKHSRDSAQLHAKVNQLVIDTLGEGVLVVDAKGEVHVLNPAAKTILGLRHAQPSLPLLLHASPAWASLETLAAETFSQGTGQSAEFAIAQAQGSARAICVRTQLTPSGEGPIDSLCVMFLQDLRALEARIRTEKLAAMGRMSAAVAHEIRNPLAAISQACALLAEDLVAPEHAQLTTMVLHNAQRLARIVEDVLDVSCVDPRGRLPSETMGLDPAVHTIVREWTHHHRRQEIPLLLEAAGRQVLFDIEHVRRILVNLLDNAARHVSSSAAAIRVATHPTGDGRVSLRIWSDGAPLEPTVQDHLFEPFFSSESRSSGLGLFICRELCERHGATIGYERRAFHTDGTDEPEGNEFIISFAATHAPAETIGA